MTTEIKTLADVERTEAKPLEQRLQGCTGYETLLATVARFPERIAITALEAGKPLGPGRNLTFSQLLENVNRTANLFRSRGLRADESVTHFLPLVPEGFYVKIAAETVHHTVTILIRMGFQYFKKSSLAVSFMENQRQIKLTGSFDLSFETIFLVLFG